MNIDIQNFELKIPQRGAIISLIDADLARINPPYFLSKDILYLRSRYLPKTLTRGLPFGTTVTAVVLTLSGSIPVLTRYDIVDLMEQHKGKPMGVAGAFLFARNYHSSLKIGLTVCPQVFTAQLIAEPGLSDRASVCIGKYKELHRTAVEHLPKLVTRVDFHATASGDEPLAIIETIQECNESFQILFWKQ